MTKDQQAQELIESIASKFKVSVLQLKTDQTHSTVTISKMIAFELSNMNYSCREIGLLLNKSKGTISKNINSVKGWEKYDKMNYEKLQIIKQILRVN